MRRDQDQGAFPYSERYVIIIYQKWFINGSFYNLLPREDNSFGTNTLNANLIGKIVVQFLSEHGLKIQRALSKRGYRIGDYYTVSSQSLFTYCPQATQTITGLPEYCIFSATQTVDHAEAFLDLVMIFESVLLSQVTMYFLQRNRRLDEDFVGRILTVRKSPLCWPCVWRWKSHLHLKRHWATIRRRTILQMMVIWISWLTNSRPSLLEGIPTKRLSSS